MDRFVITMLANIIMKTAVIISVVVAAIHFEQAGMLWLWVLVPFVGYEWKGGEDDEFR